MATREREWPNNHAYRRDLAAMASRRARQILTRVLGDNTVTPAEFRELGLALGETSEAEIQLIEAGAKLD